MSLAANKNTSTFGHTLLTGLLVTAVILLIKWCFEHHRLYQGYQSSSYVWLQSRLRPPVGREDLPVAIVDIHQLAPIEKQLKERKFLITPRNELLDLISKVAEQGPSVIGVDIDFSPNQFGYMDPENDQVFFRKLMEITKGTKVPIFLGIRRSQEKSPERWLGAAEFKSLPASIWIPPDQRKVLKSVEISKEPAAEPLRGRSMAQALAEVHLKHPIQSSEGWIIRSDSHEEIAPNVKAEEFLVDFSPLKLMQDLRLTTRNPSTIADLGWTLQGKVVLIGDGETNDTRDTYGVPNDAYPSGIAGIFKHAAGVYTLVKAPLYELTPLGRIVVDFSLALMVLVPVALLRHKVAQDTGSTFAEHTAVITFTVVVIILAFFVGVMTVHLTRVMWDDLPFVILALCSHRIISKIVYLGWTGAQRIPELLDWAFTKRR
ncbi:MAG TPA: CHASE2 domain-containing protein [Pyrinomonadaceae bacterium]|nr:CHASE2 domain-containing protein [Pyrinomonadaceae bacterium]